MSYYWLLLTIPLGLFGLISAPIVILQMTRIVPKAELFTVPLAPEMTLDFKEPGQVLMHLQGPDFTDAFAGLKYQLQDLRTEQPVNITRNSVGMRTGIPEGVRVLYGIITVKHPGRYFLTVAGLSESRNYGGCAIALTRPYGADMVAHIIAILGAVGCFAVGLIFSGVCIWG